MSRIVRFALLSASGLALSAGAALADYELNILHINDFHSRIEAINKFDSTCSAEEEGKNECFGGAARLKTAIDQTRAALAGKNVLLLNAGDNFQGSLFYTTYKGAAEAEFLNAMKFDAMTVGNHEFDDSEDGLKIFLDKVQFPVVTANVVAGYESKIKDRIVPSLVLDVGGQKIGIVGAVANDTDTLASPGPNIMIGIDDKAIGDEVQKLKAQGVNKIIALTHVGYPRDLAVIAKIPDVDIVVGGHSHSLLSNTDKGASGPYPTMVDNPGGYKVPVVQAGSYSKYLGDLDVVFDDSGVVKSAKGDPILIDSSFKPDEVVTARIKELGAPIEALKQKVIGSTSAPIDGSRETCRAKECEMGNLVADAMLDRVKDQGMQIAFANGGGLRASIDTGEVTMGEVLTVLPFQNSLATFQLKGADVLAALESGLSQIEEGKGRFPQVAGMKYTFDPAKPAGSRVVSVEVNEGGKFVALDNAKTYGVVANNYTRAGGDGYAVFRDKAVNAYDFGPSLEDTTAAFIAKQSPYKPYLDGRIAVVATAAEVKAPALPADASDIANKAPEAGTMASDAFAAGGATKHVIVKGDTFWHLARKFYGEGRLWKKIADANNDLRARRLHIGTEINIPAK
ncbi:5'-nucleotidase C-terminal domain-containing protein [Rhizobium sp. KVB221]|uniref:5'-nucleotidase C-terminal domain-containing protein n=1 Tax=Rhizobium setariae TaxID=2801340 RepID=A0A936YSQ3_9HYPH|nr:5'-nucleotidase C-terminal domain-containing protein [Rhizobium setariae]MBL0371715.1 5'-nucleotidase C-terminal domain-containing protein [Rhizobium setariae]